MIYYRSTKIQNLLLETPSLALPPYFASSHFLFKSPLNPSHVPLVFSLKPAHLASHPSPIKPPSNPLKASSWTKSVPPGMVADGSKRN